jgi:hypothetical protein
MGNQKVYITLSVTWFCSQGFSYGSSFSFDTSLSDKNLYDVVKDFVGDLDNKIAKEEYVLDAHIESISFVSN